MAMATGHGPQATGWTGAEAGAGAGAGDPKVYKFCVSIVGAPGGVLSGEVSLKSQSWQ